MEVRERCSANSMMMMMTMMMMMMMMMMPFNIFTDNRHSIPLINVSH